jgi:hypothetical protein
MNQRATLVLATRNREKVREIQDILKTWPITLKDLDAFRRLPEVEEDGKTFEENAYRKAFFVAKELGLPAMADDSGLVVKALGGAPGIHSARYAGLNADAEQRYSKLLRELEGCDDSRVRVRNRDRCAQRPIVDLSRPLRGRHHNPTHWDQRLWLRSGLLLPALEKDLWRADGKGERRG